MQFDKKRKRKKVEKKKHFSFRIGKAKNGSLGTQFPKTKEKVFSMENFQKYIEKPCSSGWVDSGVGKMYLVDEECDQIWIFVEFGIWLP